MRSKSWSIFVPSFRPLDGRSRLPVAAFGLIDIVLLVDLHDVDLRDVDLHDGAFLLVLKLVFGRFRPSSSHLRLFEMSRF